MIKRNPFFLVSKSIYLVYLIILLSRPWIFSWVSYSDPVSFSFSRSPTISTRFFVSLNCKTVSHPPSVEEPKRMGTSSDDHRFDTLSRRWGRLGLWPSSLNPWRTPVVWSGGRTYLSKREGCLDSTSHGHSITKDGSLGVGNTEV